jgi:hypothetical protein
MAGGDAEAELTWLDSTAIYFRPCALDSPRRTLRAAVNSIRPLRIATSSKAAKPNSKPLGSGALRLNRSSALRSIPWAAAWVSASREDIPFRRNAAVYRPA